MMGSLLALLLVAGVAYYFYGYRNRSITADVNSVEERSADIATTAAVKAAFMLNSRASSLDIKVETKDNIVTLSGEVPNAEDSRTVEEIARGTKGVTRVINKLSVNSKAEAHGDKNDKQKIRDKKQRERNGS